MIFVYFLSATLTKRSYSVASSSNDPAVFKVEDDLLKIVLKTEPFQILIIKFFVFLRKSLTMISSSSYVCRNFRHSEFHTIRIYRSKYQRRPSIFLPRISFLTINTPVARIPMHKEEYRSATVCGLFSEFFFMSVSFLRFICINKLYHLVTLPTIHFMISACRVFAYAQ